MKKYTENPATFTCMQWTGENFSEFKDRWGSASQFRSKLTFSIWNAADKRWIDHTVQKGEWVVFNDFTAALEIVSEEMFALRFKEAK